MALLNAITSDLGQVRLDLHAQRDTMGVKIAVEQGRSLFNQGRQGYQAILGFGVPCEVANARDDIGCARSIGRDLVEAGYRLCGVRRIAQKPALARLGISNDRRKRLIDLMRDGRCELAQRCDA